MQEEGGLKLKTAGLNVITFGYKDGKLRQSKNGARSQESNLVFLGIL